MPPNSIRHIEHTCMQRRTRSPLRTYARTKITVRTQTDTVVSFPLVQCCYNTHLIRNARRLNWIKFVFLSFFLSFSSLFGVSFHRVALVCSITSEIATHIYQNKNKATNYGTKKILFLCLKEIFNFFYFPQLLW